MSEQGGGEAAAAAAAAPAPAASEQERLEGELRELKEEIMQLKTKIAADEVDVKSIENEAERVELRRGIAANTERLNRMEAEKVELRQEIKQLSAPVGRPTAAGGCSSSLQPPCASMCLCPRSCGGSDCSIVLAVCHTRRVHMLDTCR